MNDLQIRSDRQKKISSASRTLEKGYSVFSQGNYNEAAKIFALLFREAPSTNIRRESLYALACTQLNTASTNEEFKAAQDLWKQWTLLLSMQTLHAEDARMLGPFLHRHSPFSVPMNNSAKPQKASSRIKTDKDLLKAKQKEIAKLKAHISKVEKKVSDLKNEINCLAVLEQEIQILRHQIKSIESIDQTIQEKQKEASSP